MSPLPSHTGTGVFISIQNIYWVVLVVCCAVDIVTRIVPSLGSEFAPQGLNQGLKGVQSFRSKSGAPRAHLEFG